MERAVRAANVSAAAAEVANLAMASVEVSAALLPEIRRLGSARLDGDGDFDSERFPNSEKFFHDKKT